jgi:hypothetical protein
MISKQNDGQELRCGSCPCFYAAFILSKKHEIKTDTVYLSLGDREEKARNPVMATVGDRIREAYVQLKDRGLNCILEWNGGNHFKDPDLRTAKAFAWVLSSRSDSTPG